MIKKVIDNQSMRNKITFSTTLGLVVHAAGNYFLYKTLNIQKDEQVLLEG